MSSLFIFIHACEKDSKEGTPIRQGITKIFNAVDSNDSGIDFTNQLKEDSVINYFTYPYIYMGGGVAIGDVNNDGLEDIYFTGNMVENKLYLNKGNLQFEDITTLAGVGGDDRWVTGATMADVNADGWLDIYVSVSGKFTTTKNQLFINTGQLKAGVPTFTEQGDQYGIADAGHTTQGTFFDYDKDGDLDLYVANYPYTDFKTRNYTYSVLIQEKDPEHSDHLYRNNGNGTFDDVSQESGILNFGLSLSATVGDLNQDGWEDIYVSNDFASPDFLYLNNGDGTFSEKSQEATKHTAFFGMGTDIADFNNDGLLDILQLDMTPEDNRRNKANMASMDIEGFWEIVGLGLHYQYMQNALQLNNGTTADGIPMFSEISRLAGVSSTDWSWTALMADLDNDGWKDILITNGTRRDINNKDYFNKIEKANYEEKKKFNNLNLSLNIPAEKVDNYVFRNNHDLTFQPVINEWGLSFEGYSNGASLADLDNDGDLDVVINNIDDPISLFENTTSDQSLANFLTLRFVGPQQNPNGLGTKVWLEIGGEIQFQHLTMTRGFQSSVSSKLHFGVGEEEMVDRIKVLWADGSSQVLEDIPANQMLSIDFNDAIKSSEGRLASISPLFEDCTEELNISYKHIENNFNDYNYEILLPHAYSMNGPGLATGDVNGDGLDDFFVGAAIGRSGALYIQEKSGAFKESKVTSPWKNDKISEDMGALFFDADGDKDLDLYVVSGGNEFKEGVKGLQDRLYLNNGGGKFTKAEGALPSMRTSGSRVKAADYDQDGDLDLFVGGRIVPRSYPLPAKSYILKNESEGTEVKFVDVTTEVAPDLEKAGLVTDALWEDFNQDGNIDLVIVGEWMPITLLEGNGLRFEKLENVFEKSDGWWYSIASGDFDEDGDTDFVAGNLGLNYKYKANESESFDVYANDFDKNGKLDIVLGYYNDGVQYPLRGRQCSSQQIPAIKYKFKDYNSFASANIVDVYTEEDLEASLHYQAWNFASSFIENKGDGSFSIHALPTLAQVSSINDFLVKDFNRDGHLDVLAAGNLYASEVETPRNDAGYGVALFGDGTGGFQPKTFEESGILLNGDTKDLAMIETPRGLLILSAKNNDVLTAARLKPVEKVQ